MDDKTAAEMIAGNKAVLGIELGSTRIKAVLIGDDYTPLASGSHDWENRFENGVWTYKTQDVWAGIQDSYAKMAKQVKEKYSVEITGLKALGFSAMMHGYLPFDKNDNLLTDFRTWRNTMTGDAAKKLTELFKFNIPQRWSCAHLYQAILNGEEHVGYISFLTTLAGYVHWQLTGEKVIGVGEASGMFPIDGKTLYYNADMLEAFDNAVKPYGFSRKIKDILPKVLTAGDNAGVLTAKGAKLLDVSGKLCAGVPLCPPEGDAGTGMAATNSVAEHTGNISAGTSVFSMVVMDKELSKVYPQIDMVTTPDGKPVAMVHCNNCTSDLNAWASMLGGFCEAIGVQRSMPQILDAIFYAALDGQEDCGGVISYNYFSGEPIADLEQGRPMLVRMPDADFSFADFARSQMFSAMATLKMGMDILTIQEHVKIDSLLGHGGFFKATGVGQKLTAAAMGLPVFVMETAGEGGPWGMALLAAYMVNKQQGEILEDFLQNRVFADNKGTKAEPDDSDVKGFSQYMDKYVKGLAAEKAACRFIN